MKTWYHVFERSDYSEDSHRPTCSWCGNAETAATGTGHVDTQAEADRLNAREGRG
jgi:hypothetical protein